MDSTYFFFMMMAKLRMPFDSIKHSTALARRKVVRDWNEELGELTVKGVAMHSSPML